MHDFEVNLFFENLKIEMKVFEKIVGFWSEVFCYKLIGFRIESFLSWRISIKKLFEKSFCGEKVISEKKFLSSIFIEESDFDQNITSKKQCFDLISSAQNNKFFTLRALFKRHDFVANSFIENQSLKWNFPKKESDSEANVFLYNENLIRKISKKSGFQLRVFRSGRFRKQNILNNKFVEKKVISEK